MNVQVPPSPVSISSNDWSGPPNKYRQQTRSPVLGPGQGRRNLATPPTSGSSFGGINGAPIMNGRPGEYRGNPSPPNSIAGRSSNGSAMPNDASTRRKQSMEESLYQHYTVLKRYLASTQRDEAQEGKPNRARDKLVRLSPVQFQELSTDVYDELQRRQAFAARQNGVNMGAPEYLLPKDGFHPKRNQARQKLSTLPGPRFRALATDVFYELERRVPRFAGMDLGRGASPANSMRGPTSRSGTPSGNRRPGRQGSVGGQVLAGGYGDGPLQKSSQSNTIVPNKSYLVEDDDEADGDSLYGLNRRDTQATNRSFGAQDKIISDYQAKVEELQGKVGDLEKQVEEKNTKIEALEQTQDQEATEASQEWATVKTGLEASLAAAMALNASLQSELDRAKSMHEESEQDLRGQLETMAAKSEEDAELKTRHDEMERENQELQQDHQELQQELLEQQRVTDEVRKEAAGFLEEMKILSAQSDGSLEREESLLHQVQLLEEQVTEWKNRFARSKAQNRAVSITLAAQQPNMAIDGLLHPNGLIADFHVIEFQLAIDEAIRVSRVDPKGLLAQMKSVILAVKHITEDFETANAADPQISKLITKISGTACNYITATKNFIYSGGVSPVSLVDAAASHLSSAIVDAVHEVKMHPSEGEEHEEVDNISEILDKSGNYYSTNVRSSVSESIYSQTTAPRASQYTAQPTVNGRRPSVANGSINGTNTPATANTNVSTNSNMNGYSLREQEEDIRDLQLFLSDRSSQLTEQIQRLVTDLRSPSATPAKIHASIETIASVLTTTIKNTQAALDASNSRLSSDLAAALRQATGDSVENLVNSRARLLEAEDDGQNAASLEAWKEVARGIPPVAFEIAREVRDLVSRIGEVSGGEGEEFA